MISMSSSEEHSFDACTKCTTMNMWMRFETITAVPVHTTLLAQGSADGCTLVAHDATQSGDDSLQSSCYFQDITPSTMTPLAKSVLGRQGVEDVTVRTMLV